MLYTFLRDTFRFFGHHWIPLTVITAALGLLLEMLIFIALASVGSETDNPWLRILLALALQFLGSAWIAAAIILYLGDALSGHYLSPLEAWSRALPLVLPMLALQFLMSLGVGIGSLFFIAPGLFLLVKLGLSSFFLVLDRQSIFASFQSAWRASSGYGWTLLGGYALFYGIILLLGQVVGSLFQTNESGTSLLALLTGAALMPLSAFIYIFGFRVYSDSNQSS